MADAISLLRQFTIENKEYAIENDRFVFNDLAYPKDIKTNYLAYGFVFAARRTGNFDRMALSILVRAKIMRPRIITRSKVLFSY